ncbi:SSI family serine proteinase inhibitor [Streptomyces sp. NPDC020965]|uniref:SSI family serine proteinase inhibitor n=1 Tax=Streptomyces sp. NPDC020965 TaxID=3365105 RepID=UPI0037B50D7D
MRHLRGTIAATAALVLSGTAAATARADQPDDTALYAPSAVVLTIGKGSPAEGIAVTVERAVTLSCSPRAEGTHPSPVAACRELRWVDGRFADLPSRLPVTLCTREWDPVTVTADGAWRGQRVDWSATYNNGCEMVASLGEGAVFAF